MTIQFSHGSLKIQLKRLEDVLRAIGEHLNYIGLLLMGAMNDSETHKAAVNLIISHCPNLKEFYAAAMYINDKNFNSSILRPLFGRLEQIHLQMSSLNGANDLFANCKNLKGWTQEIMYGFDGQRLNFNFPNLELINFSKVDGIDNKTVGQFLSKNAQLKYIELTRCAIDPNILKLLAEHAPNIEKLSFNFRRSLIERSDMGRNLKYLLELKHLRALNLDCCGTPMADALTDMAVKHIPLERVGLFCCPWQNAFISCFENMNALESLNLTNVTGLNDEYLELLSKSLTQLQDLTLKYINQITIDGVIRLVSVTNRLVQMQLCLNKVIITDERYKLLLDAIKKRPEQCKLTIILWGLEHCIEVPKNVLKRNVDFLEIISEGGEMNKNTSFDYYCAGDDGGYDLDVYHPTPNCNVN